MTHHQSSPMSIHQLVHIDDPDVKMAAEVLGDMARLETRKLPPLSTPSTTPSSPLTTPHIDRLSFSSETTMVENHVDTRQPNFIHRVSNIPLVNSALRVYENSKNSSSVMKYGAEMVESFAAPIYDKFGKPALSNVDAWGCKQLDKLEERYPDYVTPIQQITKEQEEEEEEDDDARSATFALSRASLMDTEGIRKRRDSTDTHKSRSRHSSSRSTSPHRPYTIRHHHHHHHHHQKSKWHQIVMHASSAAGTTAAVISEESMKCLKYCLSWLHYASQHIFQQMTLLRRFLSQENDDPPSTVTEIKREMVDTLRKVVDVISKYAGSGLPEQAKVAVRGFILALPTRWAMLNSSKASSPTASPSLTPTQDIHETSMKLLDFGHESLEMISSVAHVFSDTIERAELWLYRLRVVGAGRKPIETPKKE
ncbi:transcription factor Opi1-domain-containing protein [Gilbertella persicaria]|uniref:transcription factor Opi1-domain-containing protein n=1 Tax=Gilbertella persicaria TaxID=101096 RepID=UPI0022205971|nr:transcription factor Opi1-domain-containing protein [Gilbertella persicaria]KAI8069848.1 transcription factor Opi1-domain-containing protein [Gilbertella persicaria]